MELDKTAIVLRQRPIADLIDLSLIVLRVYWRSLLTYAVIGAAPFFLINSFVLRPMTDYDTLLMYDSTILEESPLRARYVAYQVAMVFIEVPIAMLGVTYYLGQVLFLKPPTFQELRRTLRANWPGLLLVLGILRLGGLIGLIVAMIPNYTVLDPFLEFFWFGMILCGIILLVRAIRPFAPEILILEQAPLRPAATMQEGKSIAYRQRTLTLHHPLVGDLIGRAMAIGMVMLMTLVAMTLSELIVSGLFFGVWTWEWWMDLIFFPLNLWLLGLWATVVRFLSYLDCRTRLEGWELDLRLRAEARRLPGAVEA